MRNIWEDPASCRVQENMCYGEEAWVTKARRQARLSPMAMATTVRRAFAPCRGAARRSHNLAQPAAGVDFDAFSFGLNGMRTEHMWVSTFDAEAGTWDEGGIVPHGPLALEPSATILNYGQGIFEVHASYALALCACRIDTARRRCAGHEGVSAGGRWGVSLPA